MHAFGQQLGLQALVLARSAGRTSDMMQASKPKQTLLS